jgi:hypothetical protein
MYHYNQEQRKEKEKEYDDLKRRVNEINTQLDHRQKMNSNQWLTNAIQGMPTGGGDFFSYLG